MILTRADAFRTMDLYKEAVVQKAIADKILEEAEHELHLLIHENYPLPGQTKGNI